MRVRDIISRYKYGFVLALSLVLVEKLAWIVEPTVFGRLLDALIAALGSKENVPYTLPLLLWIGVFAVNSGFGTIRRSVDEKIYLRMFTNIAVNVAESCKLKGLDVSKAASRTELSREFITFLQLRVPDFIEQFFDLGGTVVALAFYDWRISLTCLCIALPLSYVNRVYSRKVQRLEKELHDKREDLFEVFQKKNMAQIREYYDGLARPQLKIANWGALNFGMLRLFLLGIFLVVLYIAIDLDDFTTGKIYSVVAYLWTFITSTEYLPDLMESYASLRDIQERVHTEQPAEPQSEDA